MSFKSILVLFFLYVVACSISEIDPLEGFTLTGDYTVELEDFAEITDIKKSEGGEKWTAEEIKEILAKVEIVEKISSSETLLISTTYDADDSDIKGATWKYDEDKNILAKFAKENERESYRDLELNSDSFDIAKSIYYWVGDNSYWAKTFSLKPEISYPASVNADIQCPNDKNKSIRDLSMVMSIYREKEEDKGGFWVRRNLNVCNYHGVKKTPNSTH